jgi:hypothetical protein
LHPQLAALHFPGKVDFTITREQRHRAHLAQIHAHGVIGVNRLFYLLTSLRIFSILNLFGMEKIGILIEGDTQGLAAVNYVLIFKLIHRLTSPIDSENAPGVVGIGITGLADGKELIRLSLSAPRLCA